MCYLSDNVGNLYRFREAGPSFEHLGGLGQTTIARLGEAWTLHVTPDQGTAYLLANHGLLFAIDLASGARSLVADLRELDPLFAGDKVFYGAAAWRRGRLYLATFDAPPAAAVYLTAIDPERLARALATRRAAPPP